MSTNRRFPGLVPLLIKWLLILSLLLMATSVWAQSGEADDPALLTPSAASGGKAFQPIPALPAVTVYTVKGKQSIFEQSLVGGGTQAMISNAESGDHTLVMVFMGKKYRVDLSQQELATVQANDELPLVETAETKNVLGYDCNLVWGITPGDSVKIYYSPLLTTEVNLPPFEGLGGLPLEYEIASDGMRIRYIATEIIAQDVDPDKFVADPGLRKIAFSEFAKSFAIMH